MAKPARERAVEAWSSKEIDKFLATTNEHAWAAAFRLAGFFLTPPSVWDNHVVATPDTGPDGLEPIELFDVVIGTPDNLAAWEQYLLSWPSPEHRVALHGDGTMENLGRVQDDVRPRLAGPAALRAQLLLREHFGNLAAARDVLARLSAALDDLEQPEPAPDDTEQPQAAPARRRQRKERSS